MLVILFTYLEFPELLIIRLQLCLSDFCLGSSCVSCCTDKDGSHTAHIFSEDQVIELAMSAQ